MTDPPTPTSPDSPREALFVDDPEADGTDWAHPAWWRGHDHTFLVMCQKVTEVLDGKDDGSGTACEPWDSLRRRLIALVNKSGS